MIRKAYGAARYGKIAAVSRKRRRFPMTEQLREFYSEIGKLGGAKGGHRAALNMTPEQRAERARKAARARWRKKPPKGRR